jgi:hypothetical protein
MTWPSDNTDFGDPAFSFPSDDFAPIVLDLTGNGINLTQKTSSNTFFDMNGTGYQNLTTWAGAGNGVLFVDTTGQGKLTQANQIVFTDWDPTATSDMQALADVFDTNHDGMLDSGDSQFANFFVMVTNADGTKTAKSLASLGITSINLTANAVNVALPDGSSIDGETTYTTSSGQTRTVATVTFATDADGHPVTTTTTVNADGSTTIANVTLNADGTVDYTRLLNTSASGLVKVLSDLDAGGVVTTLQTDTTVVSGSTTTETVTDYRGGAVTSTGALTASGTTGAEKLDQTTTTTVTGTGKVVTIARDQTGGGWTSQKEVDTTNADGSSSIVVSNLNPDSTATTVDARLVTTTAVSADGLTRTVTALVDGIAANSTKTVDATVVGTASGGNPAPRTETVTTTLGTTVVSKITTATTTTTGLVTRVVSSDLTDGSTLNLTTTETTATSASGSTTTAIDANADGSLRDETVSTVDTTGLLKTSKVDSTGAGSAAAPVFDQISSDNTVVNADSSRTETVTDTSNNGTLRDKSVTTRAADGVSRTATIDSDGDGHNDQTETVSVSGGVVTDTKATLAPNATLAYETVATTSASGLVKTTSTDTTGAVGTGNAPVFDLVTTDTTTHGSDGSSTEVVKDTNANGSTRDQVTTWVSANGLTTKVSRDFTGASGVADGTVDRTTTDTTTVNGDGSLTETIVTVDQYTNQLTAQTISTTANRQSKTTTTVLGTTGLAKQIETVTTQANGTVVDQTVKYDSTSDVLGATTVSVSADGLTKIVSSDLQGQSSGTTIAYDRVVTDQTTINADGSRSEVVSTTSRNGSLVAKTTAVTSANGLSITTSSDNWGQGWADTVTTDVTTIATNGARTETVTDANNTGTRRDQTVTVVSATGLSKSKTQDFDGDGTVDLSTTDTTTVNADGSRTEVIADTNSHGLRDQTTVTSGVVGTYGQATTIQVQSNGSVPTYTAETIQTGADGTVSDTTLHYAVSGGSELFGTKTTTSANGLVKGSYTDTNGDGTWDVSTVDTTVINTDGSHTETLAKSNAGGLIAETVTQTSANGLWITTSVDANGATSSGSPVFNRIETDDTVFNTDGSRTETVTETNKAGSAYEKTVVTTSADQQTVTTSRYLNESGTFANLDQKETVQTQANGSIVDKTLTYGPTNALLDTMTKTTSGNGLVVTTTWANSTGIVTDTQTDTKTLAVDGSRTEAFTDVGTSNATITTSTSANALVRTTVTSLSTSAGSFKVTTADTTTIAKAGGSTEVVTDKIGTATAAADTVTTTISANGRTETVITDENGDGKTDISDQTVLALDGSKTETTNWYTPGTDPLAMSIVVATSVDGRTITTTRSSDYDGSKYDQSTDTFVERADGSTRETRATTGSFGAAALGQTVTVTPNTDGSTTATTTDTDTFGSTYGNIVASTSANGLAKSFAYDTTGQETAANLAAASVALLTGAALPSTLLVTDIVESDITTLNADGSRTEVIQTSYGNSIANLRSKTSSTVSANGLVTTTSIDDDGNGVCEQVDTTTVAPDGSTTTVANYYGDTTATTSTLVGSTTTTTSANGLVTTMVASSGITDTTTRFADANGSYQWSRTVTAGSVAANSETIFYNVNGTSSHYIDANGIDTWSWNDGYGDIATTAIDLVTEKKDIAVANELFVTLFGQPMDDAVTEYLGQFMTNGVLDRQTLAEDIVGSQEYEDNFGVPIVISGTTNYLYQGFDVFAAFENALGRLPTAEEMGVFDGFMATNPSPTNIAAMAVALAQYATDEGAINNRTQLDQNQDLISTLPAWTSPAASMLQISTAGTYSRSNSFIFDYNSSTGKGVTTTINGNNDIVLAMMNSNITLNGYDDAVDDADATVTITASNASLMVESGGIETITGSNDQISQVGATQVTLVSGTGDSIYIAPGAPPTVGPDYNKTYSTTSASNASITLGTGVGTSAAPDQISGSSDTIMLNGTDFLALTGSSDTIKELGVGNSVTATGSNNTFVYKAGFGSETVGGFTATNGDVISLASSEFANFAAVLSGATNSGSNVVITGTAADTLTLVGMSKSALAASQFTFHV